MPKSRPSLPRPEFRSMKPVLCERSVLLTALVFCHRGAYLSVEHAILTLRGLGAVVPYQQRRSE